jgi:predicted RNase H-like HicB family nuclease
MVMSGPATGSVIILGAPAIERLENEYQRVIRSENKAFSRGKEAIRQYVEDLERQAQAAPAQQEPPKKDTGEPPSSDRSTI